MSNLDLPILTDIPLIGPVIFGQDPIFLYFDFAGDCGKLVFVPHPCWPDLALDW